MILSGTYLVVIASGAKHVWTALGLQGLAAIFDANIACGHVSGLLMRQAYAAGPRWVSLADRSQTIQWHRCAVASVGVSDPGRNRSPSSASLQIVRYFGFLRHRHAPPGCSLPAVRLGRRDRLGRCASSPRRSARSCSPAPRRPAWAACGRRARAARPLSLIHI